MSLPTPKGYRDEDLLRLVDLCPFLSSEKLQYDDAAVLKILQRNSKAACLRHTYRCGIGNIHPLALVVALGGSLQVIQLMVQACPEALEERLSGRRNVLHYAVAEGVDVETIRYLTSQHPSLLSEKDSFQAIPLHLAATYPSSPISVLQHLLRVHPEGARTLDHRLQAPIHRAYKARADLEKVLALVEANPDSLGWSDWTSRTPLDWAENITHRLSDPIPEVVEVLEMVVDILSIGSSDSGSGNDGDAGGTDATNDNEHVHHAQNILRHFRSIQWWGGICMAFAMNIRLVSFLNFPTDQLPELLALLGCDNCVDVNSKETEEESSSLKFRMESVYSVLVQCPDVVGSVPS